MNNDNKKNLTKQKLKYKYKDTTIQKRNSSLPKNKTNKHSHFSKIVKL